VEGRLQGDSRPPRRPAVRLRVVAAAILLAALVGSVLLSANDVLRDVDDSVARDSKLTSAERRHAAGDRLGFRSAPFDRFRAQLSPRERYAVDVPSGAKGPFITRGAVVRAYSAFYFLPAIQTPRAERVFRYRFR
jgi:heme exporter protein D